MFILANKLLFLSPPLSGSKKNKDLELSVSTPAPALGNHSTLTGMK